MYKVSGVIVRVSAFLTYLGQLLGEKVPLEAEEEGIFVKNERGTYTDLREIWLRPEVWPPAETIYLKLEKSNGRWKVLNGEIEAPHLGIENPWKFYIKGDMIFSVDKTNKVLAAMFPPLE